VRNRTVSLLLPGDSETITRGYIYDWRFAGALDPHGWRVQVIALDASLGLPPR